MSDNPITPSPEVTSVTSVTPAVPVQAPVAVVTNSGQKLQMKDFLIPLSIVLAGIFVGAALYMSGSATPKSAPVVAQNNGNEQPTVDTTNKVDPVTDKDHYVGNLNAPVKIIEYSDFECPFCKKFHTTAEAVSKKYGDKVVWIYRQFPLEQLHTKAPKIAMSSECVAELGGNDAFWKFTNGYFDVSLSNDRTDIETVIPKLVAQIGINKTKFDECVASGRHQDVIDANSADAVETGGRGTPWTIVIGPDGKTYAVNGAQPQAVFEKTIETALASK